MKNLLFGGVLRAVTHVDGSFEFATLFQDDLGSDQLAADASGFTQEDLFFSPKEPVYKTINLNHPGQEIGLDPAFLPHCEIVPGQG